VPVAAVFLELEGERDEDPEYGAPRRLELRLSRESLRRRLSPTAPPPPPPRGDQRMLLLDSVLRRLRFVVGEPGSGRAGGADMGRPRGDGGEEEWPGRPRRVRGLSVKDLAPSMVPGPGGEDGDARELREPRESLVAAPEPGSGSTSPFTGTASKTSGGAMDCGVFSPSFSCLVSAGTPATAARRSSSRGRCQDRWARAGLILLRGVGQGQSRPERRG